MASYFESIGYGQRLTALSRAKIPVVKVPFRETLGPPQNATQREKISNLLDKLQLRLLTGTDVLFKTDTTAAIALQNPAAHNSYGSVVWWFVNHQNNQIVPEHQLTWDTVSRDKDFTHHLDLNLKRQARLGQSVYFFDGYLDPDDPATKIIDPLVAWPYSSQTMPVPHAHIVNKHLPEQFSYFLHLPAVSLFSDLRSLNAFANFAGEEAIARSYPIIQDFGEKRIELVQYLTSLDEDGYFEFPRNLFGFYNLSDARKQITWLRETVSGYWLDFCRELIQTTPTFNHPNFRDAFSFFKESAVFNATVMYPTQQDKEIAKSNYPVWVAPFSIAHAQNILNGIIINK